MSVVNEYIELNGTRHEIVPNDHRNLLDNGWFTINQRGVTTLSANGYHVDRWILDLNGNGSSTSANYGVSLTVNTSGSYTDYVQRLESTTAPAGNIYTLSILASKGTTSTGACKIIVVFADNSSKELSFNANGEVASLTFTASSAIANVRVRATTVGRTDVRAMKLEYGSESTLALDHAPDYEIELLKCQRFFERLANLGWVNIVSGYQVGFALLCYKVKKRVMPVCTTVGFVGKQIWTSANATSIINSVSINTTDLSGVTLQINASYHNTSNTFMVIFDSNNYIDVSADL